MIKYKEVFSDSKVYNCLASTLATLCREQDLNFELMLLGDWKFNFDTYEGSKIGGLVCKNKPDYYDLLWKYHNIEVIEKKISSIDELKLCFDSPIAEKGFAVVYDTFYCPWVYNYQKEHQKHFSLALGFQENGNLLCCDTVPYSEETELPIWDLLKSEFCTVTIKKENNTNDQYNYAEIIKNIANDNLSPGGTIETLIDYANLIENEFCVEKENKYIGTNFWFRAPFLVDMEWLAHSRATFHVAIKYLLKTNEKSNFFKYVEKQFKTIAEDCYTMFLSCWKMFLMPGYNDAEARKELSDAIKQLAFCEERIAKEIIEYGGTSYE